MPRWDPPESQRGSAEIIAVKIFQRGFLCEQSMAKHARVRLSCVPHFSKGRPGAHEGPVRFTSSSGVGDPLHAVVLDPYRRDPEANFRRLGLRLNSRRPPAQGVTNTNASSPDCITTTHRPCRGAVQCRSSAGSRHDALPWATGPPGPLYPGSWGPTHEAGPRTRFTRARGAPHECPRLPVHSPLFPNDLTPGGPPHPVGEDLVILC